MVEHSTNDSEIKGSNLAAIHHNEKMEENKFKSLLIIKNFFLRQCLQGPVL